jgi:hypothetical protein
MKAEAQFPTPINATFAFGKFLDLCWAFLICDALIKTYAALNEG